MTRRHRTLWLLLLLLACNVDRQPDGRFVVGCLGDSNTEDGWHTGSEVRWCGILPSILPTLGAMSGGRFQNIPLATENHGQRSASIFAVPIFLNGLPYQLQHLTAAVDAVVAAFGTNDANSYASYTPAQAIADLQAAEAALRAQGIPLWVATAPPSTLSDPQQAWQADFTARVPATFCRWVDFTSGFAGLLEADGIHLTASGQMLRAQRVRDALTTRDCA